MINDQSPVKHGMGPRRGATRRQLLRSAGALTLLQIPAWAQTGSLTNQGRLKERCDLAVIGQVDHGKTTLTAAITKVLAEQSKAASIPYDQINRAPIESAYGSKIAIARVQYETDRRHYAQVDCPSHGDIVKMMITGAATMDGAILVVSATDGPQPQAREHVMLARQLGVPALVVFLNKMDLVADRELPGLVESEVRELLARYDFPAEKIPIIRGSALAALEGRDDRLGKNPVLGILKAVDDYIPQPPRSKDRPFLMPIATVSSVGGRTVATGHIERGVVKTEDEVEVVGPRITQRRKVGRVELLNGSAGQGEAGQEVHCTLQGTTGNAPGAGQVLSKPGSIKPHTKFKAEVYFLNKEEGGRHDPILPNYRPQFHIHTVGVTGVVNLSQGTLMVMPGDNVDLEVHLTVPTALEKKLRFTIRDGDRTVGVGVVTSIVK
jgi:elongation factor Tu